MEIKMKQKKSSSHLFKRMNRSLKKSLIALIEQLSDIESTLKSKTENFSIGDIVKLGLTKEILGKHLEELDLLEKKYDIYTLYDVLEERYGELYYFLQAKPPPRHGGSDLMSYLFSLMPLEFKLLKYDFSYGCSLLKACYKLHRLYKNYNPEKTLKTTESFNNG